VNTAQHRAQVRDFLISRRERINLEHSQAHGLDLLASTQAYLRTTIGALLEV
jgi:hypothetical protein